MAGNLFLQSVILQAPWKVLTWVQCRENCLFFVIAYRLIWVFTLLEKLYFPTFSSSKTGILWNVSYCLAHIPLRCGYLDNPHLEQTRFYLENTVKHYCWVLWPRYKCQLSIFFDQLYILRVSIKNYCMWFLLYLLYNTVLL